MKIDERERVQKGQIVELKPQWQDPGDTNFTWVAIDNEEDGRVTIAPLNTGLSFPPIYTVNVAWLLHRGRSA